MILLALIISGGLWMPKNIQTKMVKIGATKGIIPGNIGFVNCMSLAIVKL